MPCATGQSLELPREQRCRRFPVTEILLATQNFSEKWVIGQGGFGKVYVGIIGDGPDGSRTVVAIKRLDLMSNQGAPEFWAEIEMLSKLRHCNLVSLIGYCNDSDEMILVYDFMPHGTLDDHLHKNGSPLTWLQRLKICLGAARGLEYLHTGTGIEQGVIHRDVKSSNILLGDSLAAKLSDFGLSRMGPINQPITHVSTGVKGTFGYLDPEYLLTCRLTRKSDVYSFGVVLLEVLCGRRAVDMSLDEEQWGLARWAQDCIKVGKLEQIIDSNLRGQISLNCLKEFAQITVRCLQGHPKDRPTMAEVVACLEHVLELQKMRDYSAIPAEKISFTRKILKCFFPSPGNHSVHEDASLSGTTVTSYDAFSDKDLAVSKDSRNQLPPWGSVLNSSNIVQLHEMDDPDIEEQQNERANLDRYLDPKANHSNYTEPPEILHFPVPGNKSQVSFLDPPQLTPILQEAPLLIQKPDEDVDNGNDLMPEIAGLRISGDAFPGMTLQANGYVTNSSPDMTHCSFQWVRHLEDGSSEYIDGAQKSTYTVSADDADSYIAVEVQPLGDKKIGKLVKCFANSNRKISIHPEMQHRIDRTLNIGHASYLVSLLTSAPDTWELATLEINMKGYSIKTAKPDRVVVKEKFSPAMGVRLWCKVDHQFSIVGFWGIERYMRTNINSINDRCARDAIVLTLRQFIKRATERKNASMSLLFAK